MAEASNPRRDVWQRVRLALTCLSITVNAILSGGIYTFPLISPTLSSHLKLTQPQLTTIVTAGMIGQYPFAALVGKVIDCYGPWVCSLVASVLFSLGFGLSAWEIAKTPDDISQPSASSFYHLAVYFFLAGLGAVFSYFACLFAASKNFPSHPGIASGTSLSLYGLSPLFLSLVASNLFTHEETGLDVKKYLKALAICAGIAHFIGAFTLSNPPTPEESSNRQLTVDSESPDERTSLLSSSSLTVESDDGLIRGKDGSALDLLRDGQFWVLAVLLVMTFGACEMVISNIGTIVLSLPSSSPDASPTIRVPSSDIATSTQVRLLSIANTVSRILVGPLADFVSPVASYLPSGLRMFPRKHRVSRMAFIAGSTLLLALTFVWTEGAIRTREGMWALSIGTGIAYGVTFTILPSIMSSIWGLKNLGRNFGIITYTPFVGTPLFSYLYAFISASSTSGKDGGICKGIKCWRLTFWICAGTSGGAFLGSVWLWRRWKGLM